MKGNALSKFHVGQMVNYDTKGVGNRTGIIVKLHKSCSHGVAEIRPSNGARKVSRRLQMVGSI
jgi:hypothetical protein